MAASNTKHSSSSTLAHAEIACPNRAESISSFSSGEAGATAMPRSHSEQKQRDDDAARLSEIVKRFMSMPPKPQSEMKVGKTKPDKSARQSDATKRTVNQWAMASRTGARRFKVMCGFEIGCSGNLDFASVSRSGFECGG